MRTTAAQRQAWLDWPVGLAPQTLSGPPATWRLDARTMVNVSPHTLAQEPITLAAGRWRCVLHFEELDGAARGELSGLLAALDGAFGVVRVPFFGAHPARGLLSGAPTITGSSGATAVTLAGAIPGVTGALRRGDLLGLVYAASTWVARVHQVRTDVNTDGAGAAEVAISPPLRETVAQQPVSLAAPDLLVPMRLADDEQWSMPIDHHARSSMIVELTEAF